MITKERKDWIDNASYEDMLRLVRFEDSGSPWFAGGDLTEYFYKVMGQRHNEMSAHELVTASKNVGWKS